MDIKDIVYQGLEKEERKRSKTSIDMSGLIQKLKDIYSIEKKSRNYYIVKSDNKKLHLNWRYSDTGEEFWSPSDIDEKNIENIKNNVELYLMVLIRKKQDDNNTFGFTINEWDEELNVRGGKNNRINYKNNNDHNETEIYAENKQQMIREICKKIQEKIG